MDILNIFLIPMIISNMPILNLQGWLITIIFKDSHWVIIQ